MSLREPTHASRGTGGRLGWKAPSGLSRRGWSSSVTEPNHGPVTVMWFCKPYQSESSNLSQSNIASFSSDFPSNPCSCPAPIGEPHTGFRPGPGMGGWGLEGSWVSGSRFTWLAVTPGTLSEKASQNTSTAHHSSAHVVRGVGEVLARKHEAAYSKKSTRRSLLSLLAKIKCGMLADSQAADGFLEKHFYLWIQAFKNFLLF